MIKLKLRQLAIIFLTVCVSNIEAQTYRKINKINKVFAVAPSSTIDISNKYGTIYVDTWDVDSVKVRVDFVISEKNETRFNKIKNSVEFDFSGTDYYRTIRTVFSGSYSTFFKDLKQATNLFSSSEDQTHVNYYLTVPDHINLKIDQKYGNIILPNLRGDLHINLSNGDLQARNLNGNNQLKMAFGNAKIKYFEQGTLTANFVKINISNAGRLSLDARSSDVKIGKADLIKLNTRRGSLECEEIDFLFGESEFTDFYIEKLNNEINAKLTYGILRNLQLANEYTKVKITSSRADINIDLPVSKAFKCQMTYQKASIFTPPEIKWQPEKSIDDKGTIQKTGYFKQDISSPLVTLNIVDAELQITTY